MLGAKDQNQPVGADSEMAVTDLDGQGRRVRGRLLVEAIHIDIVVADPVHLSKFHCGFSFIDSYHWRLPGNGLAAYSRWTTRLRRGVLAADEE